MQRLELDKREFLWISSNITFLTSFLSKIYSGSRAYESVKKACSLLFFKMKFAIFMLTIFAINAAPFYVGSLQPKNTPQMNALLDIMKERISNNHPMKILTSEKITDKEFKKNVAIARIKNLVSKS